ncbi:hypothetical protein JD969_00850 [Planctomycetota bacterium]|nr:hypothetical protein JD969_00850 [Planctomycetota bacterium]
MTSAKEQAAHFVANETAFHLGDLHTEQPHTKTIGLSMNLNANIQAGMRQLLSVEDDLPPMLDNILVSDEFAKLKAAMLQAIKTGHKIIFTGCGATGRLSIQLDSMWRTFWQDFGAGLSALNPDIPNREDITFSVMAGGDYALIKAVEGFEDFPDFGRHQIKGVGVAEDDVVVAITEGGETSFVIGTAWQGVDVNANVFFVYNNLSDVLCKHVKRSREVIESSDITCLDIATGPMAIAGSTRMQATTSELVVVGSALEAALYEYLSEYLSKGQLADLGIAEPQIDKGADIFRELLTKFDQDENLQSLCDFVTFEQDIYAESGRVTYASNRFLIDILTDTTERAPTFSLPPFRKCDDDVSAVSWAFVKHSMLSTEDTWFRLLGRQPRCLDWDSSVYASINAPQAITDNPPKLDVDELYKFQIGIEDTPSRYDVDSNALVMVTADFEEDYVKREGFLDGFKEMAKMYKDTAIISIGENPLDLGDAVNRQFYIKTGTPASPLNLWKRVTIKIVMNTVSTATMALAGRVTSNWMTCVQASNKKLVDRSTRLIAELTECDYPTACERVFEALEAVAEIDRTEHRVVSPVEYAIDKYGLAVQV